MFEGSRATKQLRISSAMPPAVWPKLFMLMILASTWGTILGGIGVGMGIMWMAPPVPVCHPATLVSVAAIIQPLQKPQKQKQKPPKPQPQPQPQPKPKPQQPVKPAEKRLALRPSSRVSWMRYIRARLNRLRARLHSLFA
jgi:hypothetical protein